MGDISDGLAGSAPRWILINIMVDIIGGGMGDNLLGDISDGLVGFGPSLDIGISTFSCFDGLPFGRKFLNEVTRETHLL